MYESHWKLTNRPFENRVDGSGFYYPAESHQAAMLKLRYAIENRRGAALLSGPSGIGKSLLIHLLRKQLHENFQPIVPIVFPAMEAGQLVRYLAESLPDSNDTPCPDLASALGRIQRFLLRNLEAEKHAVVIIDEAQILDQFQSLDTLRLLLNIASEEAASESAWTIVLVGQSNLLAHVHRTPALDERLSVKCVLSPLTLDETISYVQHRVRGAGGDAERLFESSALERVYALTHGIPRRINRLCDLALMLGFAEDRTIVTADLVESVQNDLMPASII